MRPCKYFAWGLILGIGLTWGWFSFSEKNKAEPALPALAPASQQQAPFAVIYNFYQALATGREDQLSLLVTPELLITLQKNQFLQKWQQRRQQDPSLRFVFFLIKEQEVDLKTGTARARGNAEWVSARQGTLSVPQTIIILNDQGKWKIKDIKEQG
ncbi:hypothetical protein [Neomoorella mulderi]|uniref:DUF3828 domain-containing protein n=1 Tax=Moorella mulderi DSM 14980 TaxID=1122241 RepID=A0A151ATC5_9FIRM|nr:hypothetical protein [Moorella mulderi]KYH30908.1 hypothetical protein MOMUL_27820 [Moorella mulderi DSM 14980]